MGWRGPGVLDRVNAVTRLWENPCGANWLVYAETAVKPAGELVLALLTFGLDDIIRGYARPAAASRGRRGGRLTRALSRQVKKLPGGKVITGGIPEIGEAIGRRLPGADILRARSVTDGVKYLWVLDGVLQRILFWWMLIDLTSEFAYDWSTAIMRTEACFAQFAAWTYQEQFSINLGIPSNCVGNDFFTIVEEGGPFPGEKGQLRANPGRAFAFAGATFRNDALVPGVAGVGLRFLLTGGTEHVVPCHFATVPPLGSISLGVTGSANNCFQFEPLYRRAVLGCVIQDQWFGGEISPV